MKYGDVVRWKPPEPNDEDARMMVVSKSDLDPDGELAWWLIPLNESRYKNGSFFAKMEYLLEVVE